MFRQVFAGLIAALSLAWALPAPAASPYMVRVDRRDVPSGAFQIANLTTTGAGNSAVAPPAPTLDTSLGALFQKGTALKTTSALGVTNAKTMIFSWWQMGTQSANVDSSVTVQELFVNNSSAPPGTCEANGSGSSPGICIVTADGSSNFWRAQLNLNDSTGTTSAHGADPTNNSGRANCPNTQWLQPRGWHWYVYAVSLATGNWATYIDGVDVKASGCMGAGVFNNITPDLNNAGGLLFFNAPVQLGWGYLGTTFISLDPNVLCTSTSSITTTDGHVHTCAAANTIPTDILSAFATGCPSACVPVQLGTTGTTPTGRQPEVLMYGDGDAFRTNHGSATTSSFPLFATVPDAVPALPAAPFGPAGIPAHQATQKWVTSLSSGSLTGITTNSADHTPAVGDLVVIWAESSNSGGGVPNAMTCPTGGANTWVQIGTASDANELQRGIGCYAFLQSGDTSGAWTITCASSTCGARSNGYVMQDYVNVASVDSGMSSMVAKTSATSQTTPASQTVAVANETVVSTAILWRSYTPTLTYPAGTVRRYSFIETGSQPQIAVSDRYAVPTGAFTQQTFTLSTADSAIIGTLGLEPN